MRDVKPAAPRSTTRRLNRASSSVGQRMLSLSSCWLSLASTVTFLPARPARMLREFASLRRKAAAALSSMFRRLSRESAVSLLRVLSVRNSLKRKSLSESAWTCVGTDCTASSTWRTGRSAASGAMGATPKAVTPVPSSRAARVAVTRLGWRRRVLARGRSTWEGDGSCKANSQQKCIGRCGSTGLLYKTWRALVAGPDAGVGPEPSRRCGS
jgi:hypothetical protein